MWVVVPVKPFAFAKRRLATILSEGERALLARAMFTDLLTTLAGCARISGVVVVTREKAVAPIAARFGVVVLPEAEPGLSKAVLQGARYLREQNVNSLLMLPTDVPLARSAEIDQVVARHGWAPAVTLVSDEAGYGLDVDTPDDLRRLLAYELPISTIALLLEHDVLSRLAPRPIVSAGGQWNL